MLKREKHKMPAFIKSALEAGNLMSAYKNRPPYQQNDYIGWIMRAKREETKQKRLQQMIDEMQKGNVYMKMRWSGKYTYHRRSTLPEASARRFGKRC